MLTDGPDEVLKLLQMNRELNHVHGECSQCQLWWGEGDNLYAMRDKHLASGLFHNIVGSDLFYNAAQRSVVVKCFETVRELLSPSPNAAFHLSFTRRTLDISVILEVAAAAGFSAHMDEDHCWDLWGNNTDGATEFWQNAIFTFRRRLPATVVIV